MRRAALAMVALIAALPGTVVAQVVVPDVAALRVRSLAAACANCHGSEGRALPDAAVPGLAGMPAGYLVEQMKAFRIGARPATVMHQIARGYNDAQVAQLAAFFAAQPVAAR